MTDAVLDKILVAFHGQDAVAVVSGRGNFKVSGAVKEFGLKMLEMGANRLVFDLRACEGMDSTFMGVLAGLAMKYRKHQPPVAVVMVNLTPKTLNLLQTLGVHQVVETYMQDATPPDLAPLLRASCDAGVEQPAAPAPTKLILEAHEVLTELDPQNREKFKDVIQYLREDVDRDNGTAQHG